MFQLLPHTAELDPPVALVLDRAHRKRNELEYTGAADVTEAETAGLITASLALQKALLDWIKRHRPQFSI